MLKRLMCPDDGELSVEQAQSLVDLDFSDADYERMEDLSSRAEEGGLTEDEHGELEAFLNISQFLVQVHLRARSALEKLAATIK